MTPHTPDGSLANSAAANLVKTAPGGLPTSFNGDGTLFAGNLFLMTAFTCLGVMFAGWMALSIARHWSYDRPRHPVTIWRASWFLAGLALTLRSGAEAANLWAWDPQAATVAARAMLLKRYVDPIALCLAGGWLLLVILSYNAMVAQLRKQPFPVDMFARIHSLKRPAVVVGLSFLAAVGVALTRG